MSVDDSNLERQAAEFPYLLNETENCSIPFDKDGGINDPEKWTGNWVNSTTPDVAAQLCEGCHVLEQCLAFAIVNEEREHIWGGTTPEERKELIRARRQRTKKRDDWPSKNTEGA